jgi:Tfp pilus assembly protein PilN
MRAVNLIPADDRRGAGGAAGRSGGGAYILLGALALFVVMSASYVLAGKSVTDKKSELAQVTRQAEAAEAKAKSLGDYTRFAAMRTKRVQTVSQLANSRFDWSHALHEVARVLPENAWLTSLTGTTSPGVQVGGTTGQLRSALAVPAIDVTGCTTSQSSVAKMMARMRLIDGVQRVSLEDSAKGDAASGAGSGDSANSGDCRGGSSHFPLFHIVVFYAPSAASATASAGGTATASATTASSATPASTTTPSSATPSTTTTPGGTP